VLRPLVVLALLAAALPWAPCARAQASDSLPPESPAAPLLSPERPFGGDTAKVSPKARARTALLEGLELKSQGSCAPAIMKFRRAATLDPTIREAHFAAGECFMRVGEFEEAAKEFAAEIERHPDHLAAARELGMALARGGYHERAVAQLEKVTRVAVGDAVAWYELGFAYMGAGRSEDAERALRRAIRLQPKLAEAHRDLGTILIARNQTTEGVAELRRAIRLDPASAGAWMNLGNFHRRAGRSDSAMVYYRAALEADPDFALAHQELARLLADAGRKAEAVEVLRTWLVRRPEDANARLQAVRLLAEMGRRDQATEMARDGVRRLPRDPDNRFVLAMTLQDDGRPRAALQEFRAAHDLFRGRPEAQEQVRRMVLTLEANAPDSIKAIYAAPPWHAAPADSAPAERSRRP
jgi:tetratricopeptide (TPR) repeat protein